jgi:hypothetical protein
VQGKTVCSIYVTSTECKEIARRIVSAVDDAYNVVANDKHKDITINYKTEKISLPMRIVTEAEYEKSRQEVETLKTQIEADSKAGDRLFRRVCWEGDVIRRYEQQKTNPQPILLNCLQTTV